MGAVLSSKRWRQHYDVMCLRTHHLKAEMACTGCSNAITKILKKFDNVENVDCDLDAQKVTVTGKDLDAKAMLEKLEKWGSAAGKKVELGQ